MLLEKMELNYKMWASKNIFVWITCSQFLYLTVQAFPKWLVNVFSSFSTHLEMSSWSCPSLLVCNSVCVRLVLLGTSWTHVVCEIHISHLFNNPAHWERRQKCETVQPN